MPRLFNGSTDLIKIVNHAKLDNLGPMTFSLWYRPLSAGGGPNFGTIVCKNNSNSFTNGCWVFQHNGSLGQIVFQKNFGTQKLITQTAGNPIAALIYQHLAVTWDGSKVSANAHIYRNLIETQYGGATDGIGAIQDDGIHSLYIGNTGNAQLGANGEVAFLQIFNIVLSLAQIAQTMRIPGSVQDGLVGFWPMQGESSKEIDYSGNSYYGTLTGTSKSIAFPQINGIFLPKRSSKHSYTVPAVVSTPVTFDFASSSGYEPALSTYNWNHTVANQPNRFLEVSVGIFALGQVTSITFNGKNLSFVRADVKGVYRSEIWRMVAPDVGTFAIVVTLNTSLTSIGNAQSYYNVDQNDPIDIEQGNTGTNSPATGSITPETDSCMLLANLVASTASGITSAGGQTSRTANNGALGTDASDEQGVITPISSKTFTWNNLGALDSWAVSVIAISPVQGAPSNPVVTPPKKFRKLLLDVGL